MEYHLCIHPGHIQARDWPLCAPYFISSHKGHSSFAFTGGPLHILGIKFHADLEIRRDYVSPIVASFAQHGFLFGVLGNGRWSWVLLLHHHPSTPAGSRSFLHFRHTFFLCFMCRWKDVWAQHVERTQLSFRHRLVWGPWTSGPEDVEHVQSSVANYIHFVGWLDLAVGVLVFQKSKKRKFFFWYASVRKNSIHLTAPSLILKLQRGYLRAKQLVSSYTWESRGMDSLFTHHISCGIGCFKSETLSMEPWRAEVHEQNQSSGSNDQAGWSISG